MADTAVKQILSTVKSGDLIGRKEELSLLRKHARKTAGAAPKALLCGAAPGTGLSEVLKQTFDEMFFEAENETIPVYFEFRKSDETQRNAAVRFLQTFLRQTIAFRRRDTRILDASPDVCELAELAVPSDGIWIDRLTRICSGENRLNNERAFIRAAFSAPLRAAHHDRRIFVMLDNFEIAGQLSGDTNLVEELKDIFSRAQTTPIVFAGKRRFVFGAGQTGNAYLKDAETLEIKPLSFADSGRLAENLAERKNVSINDQTRDLLALQLQGNPALINSMFAAAEEIESDLDTFKNVEKIYAEELFGGRISGFYDSMFDSVTTSPEIQKQITGLLYDALTVERQKVSVESWRRHVGFEEPEFQKKIGLLNAFEILDLSTNMIGANRRDEVLRDYIIMRFRLEIRSDARALVIHESIAEYLKKAPEKMAKFYRRRSALGLRELLAVFDCQETPISLLYYNVFKELHKGRQADDREILEDARREKEKTTLPQIVFTTQTVSLYAPIGKLTDNERSAVALGFESANYIEQNEIVWIAAEVESKLEAPAELAQFWCDRLEMVAIMCGFENYRLWLVAPEGFTEDAFEILRARNAIGSSRRQVELLAKFLGQENIIDKTENPFEFEMIVPMGEDTELIAAHAVEEIARRHDFSTQAINQIKTALVEAFINASEHSHSPDRKIHQKFEVRDGRIFITISNRGLRFSGAESSKKNPAGEFTPAEGRRGWGLKLMKTLMDEVKFERVDDGTKISMVKSLVK